MLMTELPCVGDAPPPTGSDRARGLAFVWHAHRHAAAMSGLDASVGERLERVVAQAEALASDDDLAPPDRSLPPEMAGALLADPCRAATGLVADERALALLCEHAIAATARALRVVTDDERVAMAGLFHALRDLRGAVVDADPGVAGALEALRAADGLAAGCQDELLAGGVHGHLRARAQAAEQAAGDAAARLHALALRPDVPAAVSDELDAIAEALS